MNTESTRQQRRFLKRKNEDKNHTTSKSESHPMNFMTSTIPNELRGKQSKNSTVSQSANKENSQSDAKTDTNCKISPSNANSFSENPKDSELQQFYVSLEFALENKIFPKLHIEAISREGQFTQDGYQYKKTTDKDAVEFIIDYLNNCWDNQKLEQCEIGYYAILYYYNEKLKIKDWSEEKRLGSRLDLYFIIRYLEKSGSFNDIFFEKIWKSAPPEIKTALRLD